jgi:hypothetical protein
MPRLPCCAGGLLASPPLIYDFDSRPKQRGEMVAYTEQGRPCTGRLAEE